jgi:hypothetical protein
MDDSTGFVVLALAGPGRLKAGLHASSVSSMSRSPPYKGRGEGEGQPYSHRARSPSSGQGW